MSLRNVSAENLIKYIKHMIRTLSNPSVIEIERTNKEEFIKYMADKYYRLRDLSMSLYDMVLEQRDNFDFPRLQSILIDRDRIRNGDISFEDASKEVGEQYFNEFVKPIVDKLPKNDKN